MAYIALYRKYRSQSFGEVIGQEHVTTVLQNAIRHQRIAHAYLLCGPRGCGKTSTARLIARALNCQAADGPTPEPCGECDMCRRIRDGSAMDVVEMDAASETGIDDVREKIIENAKYAPAEARYKVYIIDEVHDLSLKAFDSLLKTIEEPPAHVVFVLATTEMHKVPITVRSRCQRLDFKRGTLSDLTANLARVLEKEGIAAGPEAVAAVARAAEGSFRDSLSLLEQVLAYTDGELTAEAVHQAVGTVGAEVLDDVTRILAADDLRATFEKAGELVDSGKDVKQTLIALQNHLRDLLVASVAKTPQALADATPERFAQLKQQAAAFTPDRLLRMIDVLADAERDVRFTNQHRLLLERALWSILPSSLTAGQTIPQPQELPSAPRDRGAGGAKGQAAATSRVPASEPQRPSATTPSPANAPAGEAAPSTESSPSELAPPPTGKIDIDLEGIRRLWPRVLRRIVQKWPSAVGLFEKVHVEALHGRTIALGVADAFTLERADKPARREAVAAAFAEEGVAGLSVRFQRLAEEPPGEPAELSPPPPLPLEPHPPGEAVVVAGNGAAPSEPSPTPPPEDDLLSVVEAEFQGKLIEE